MDLRCSQILCTPSGSNAPRWPPIRAWRVGVTGSPLVQYAVFDIRIQERPAFNNPMHDELACSECLLDKSADRFCARRQVGLLAAPVIQRLDERGVRKASAKAFRKWVTSEVLPTIRRTGRYEGPSAANDARACEVLPPDLGTRDERDAIRVAALLVRECKDLYGQQAGRDMWQKLGFPVPNVDLPPAPAPAGTPPVQLEGDLHEWSLRCRLTQSRREATHVSELYDNYTKWCGASRAKPMHPTRFKDMVVMLFGTEEHPEMVRAAMLRK